MLSDIHSFIHFVFIGFIALFPVVNPIGTAFILSPYLINLSRKDRIKHVRKIALYAFIICVFTLLLGHWILELFGITVPIIQLAGGIMISKIGWEFLTDDTAEPPINSSIEKKDVDPAAGIEGKLFYPMTFPITTGAGTIAVLITLSAHGTSNTFSSYVLNTGALVFAVTAICILVFVCVANANYFIRYMGSNNEKIVNRIMAFLIFSVGLQIAVGGIMQLIKSVPLLS
jgi:multiple antibiotic resistance protein